MRRDGGGDIGNTAVVVVGRDGQVLSCKWCKGGLVDRCILSRCDSGGARLLVGKLWGHGGIVCEVCCHRLDGSVWFAGIDMPIDSLLVLVGGVY